MALTFRRRTAALLALTLGAALAAGEDNPRPAAPATTGPTADLARLIDGHVAARLAAEKIPAAAPATDAEFLRRVYLDLTGTIPTAAQAAAFLTDASPDKRARLIDELLASPNYGRRLADVWQGLMVPHNSDNRRLNLEPLHEWLAKQFNAGTPWDKLVADLLTCTGSQDEHGGVVYFVANGSIDKITDSVCKLFLGVQLQCAQCHNHPFTGWKQTEYWQMAAFFAKVKPDNAKKAGKNGDPVSVVEANQVPKNRRNLPEAYKELPPKFLGGAAPGVKPAEPFRPVLAKWLTAKENPYFARAFVNRTWALLFGRGFVTPVDDLNEKNQPTHPELFAALAERFAACGFDHKDLVRAICNSQTYQRSSRPAGDRPADPTLFAQMAIKPLTPQQLYDVLAPFTAGGADPAKGEKRKGAPANGKAQFVEFFNIDEGADPLEYQGGIPHALRLMNNNRLARGGDAVAQALKAGPEPAKVVDHLFLATLSRHPTEAELAKFTAHLVKQGDRPPQRAAACGDLLWALLNSGEFALNR